MPGLLGQLKGWARSIAIRKTHPHIYRSHIDNLSRIAPSARVFSSRLGGEVILAPNCVLDNCQIRANRPVTIGTRSILSGPIRIVADLNPVSIGKHCSIAPDVAIWE